MDLGVSQETCPKMAGSLCLHGQKDEHWVIIEQSQDRTKTYSLKPSHNSSNSCHTHDLIYHLKVLHITLAIYF